MNADKSFPTTATETVALSINRATKQPGRAADWKSTLPTTKTKRAAEELGCPDLTPMPWLQQELVYFTDKLSLGASFYWIETPVTVLVAFSMVLVPFQSLE